MLAYEHIIRTCYGDTDRMGSVYYGNYPRFFEIARTEMIRYAGITYKDMEDELGVALPVRTLSIEYFIPASYDDVLTIKVYTEKMPEIRFDTFYETYNQHSQLLNKGFVQLVFVNMESGRPQKAPAEVLDKLRPFFT